MKSSKNRKRLIVPIAFIVVILIMATSCTTKGETITITATNNQFDSQMFHNAVAKFIVENAFDGYEMAFSTGSSTLNWQAIINNEVDLDIESWTDNVTSYDGDVANGDIVPLGVLVPDSAQGYYVPRYVIEGIPEEGIEPAAPDLKHVKDLANYPNVFINPEDSSKGIVYGAIPGWMIDEIMYNKFVHYGLEDDFTYFRSGSEAILFASLNSAYNLRAPWVGYCYEPTWVTGKLDMVLLEDEPYASELFDKGACEIPKQELMIVSSSDFAEKAPDLAEFFAKYQTGSEIVSNALAYIDDTGASHDEAALWMLKENPGLLDEWLNPEQADKARSALGV